MRRHAWLGVEVVSMVEGREEFVRWVVAGPGRDAEVRRDERSLGDGADGGEVGPGSAREEGLDEVLRWSRQRSKAGGAEPARLGEPFPSRGR